MSKILDKIKFSICLAHDELLGALKILNEIDEKHLDPIPVLYGLQRANQEIEEAYMSMEDNYLKAKPRITHAP